MNIAKYEAYHQWGGDPESRWIRTYEMPFAFVGAGLGTFAAIGTASGFAATAIATAAAIATVATTVGIVLTVVGAITGDNDLMKIGGIVGLAGGIGSIATSALNAGLNLGIGAAASATEAAAAAAPAASSGSSATAQGGLQGAKAAITPAFESGVGQSSGLIGASGGLGSAGTEAATGALGSGITAPVAGVAQQTVSQGLGSNIGTNVGEQATTGGEAFTGSFFDYIKTPKGALELGQIASPAIGGLFQGMSAQENNNAAFDLKQQQIDLNRDEFDFKKEQDARAYANANSPASGSLSVTPWTKPPTTDAQKAMNARRTGEILTGARR